MLTTLDRNRPIPNHMTRNFEQTADKEKTFKLPERPQNRVNAKDRKQNGTHCSSTTLEARRQWKAFKHSEGKKYLLNELIIWKYFFK